MIYFKSDVLKVLMIFLVIFSFTTGCPQTALQKCESGMQKLFLLDEPLLECIGKAIRKYTNDVLPYENEDESIPFTSDLNTYYWTMYKLVSAVNIQVKEEFCGRLDEFAGRFTHVPKPKFEHCVRVLASFEVVRLSNIGMDLKTRILFNALYMHVMHYSKDDNGIYKYRSYKDAYLDDIIRKIELINDNNYTPRRFCEDTHNPKYKNDEGTSQSS